MLYTREELCDKLCEDINNVYSVFVNHFGEDKVDLKTQNVTEEIVNLVEALETDTRYDIQDLDRVKEHISSYAEILVYWPEVTVTNEYNKSIVITDLFALVKVNIYGKKPYESAGFWLNRSSYTLAQFTCNYLHSHISGIPKDNFQRFQTPCLGRGPIRDTIQTLRDSNDEAFWMLFCEELARYVTVESITGVPYKRLENVGKAQPAPAYRNYDTGLLRYPIPFIKDFIKYYLTHGHLVINYVNKMFVCGMKHYDYVVDVSNTYIDFCNQRLREHDNSYDYKKLLVSIIAADNRFYAPGSTNIEMERYVGREVCTFKGRTYRISIVQSTNPQEHISLMLDQKVAMYILVNILEIINYNYGRNQTQTDGRTSETIRYL